MSPLLRLLRLRLQSHTYISETYREIKLWWGLLCTHGPPHVLRLLSRLQLLLRWLLVDTRLLVRPPGYI